VLSGRGLCDELITRPEESYRLCCVVVCDLETSRMGAPYIYDISCLRVNAPSSRTVNEYSMWWSSVLLALGTEVEILFMAVGCSVLGSFAEVQKVNISFVVSVRTSARVEQLGSHLTDFHEIWYLSIFGKSIEKIQVSSLARVAGTPNEDGYTFMLSRWIIRRMGDVSGKVIEKI